MTNVNKTVLYIGVTNSLNRRVFEHKVLYRASFASKYNCTILVYYEEFSEVGYAIKREKQMKKWRRSYKENLINVLNPEWLDLSADWYLSEDFELFESSRE